MSPVQSRASGRAKTAAVEGRRAGADALSAWVPGFAGMTPGREVERIPDPGFQAYNRSINAIAAAGLRSFAALMKNTNTSRARSGAGSFDSVGRPEG